ncbi:hypothetical protein [Klebsiella pneumoniae]|uniref:hypothetical protein n=1 Tax=Klebsiella pneumoniae TaxID=573 RepID=UPI001E4A55C3|nr:hypothetical protein [Klebsiella pneumoniae]MCB4984275.1 hypothetical protein [Klebsiella pneumoniae]
MGPDPRNFNQRVSLGRNDLLIRTFLSSKSPSKDLIIYGLEKAIRGNHDRARMTFIDFMYYWHERIFKQIKRKSR